MTPDQEVQIGTQYYEQEVLQKEQPVRSGPQAEMVERIMQRLIAVADAPDYPWEVTLLRKDSEANAFALPGGKMAVYTGILPVTQDEEGLAVVMGHEIGHVIARHGAERLTTEGLAENLIALAQARWGGGPELYQAGKTVLLTLPYGRYQESEADHIGLILMARAGYDPQRAVEFWQRMAAQSKGAPPELLSTHPSDATRIRDLEELLPEAMEVYRRSAARP